jgi:hypothetical protein
VLLPVEEAFAAEVGAALPQVVDGHRQSGQPGTQRRD